MRKIAASEFKARCLSLMDEVQRTRDEIVITKRGKPVAKLVALPRERLSNFLGAWKGKIEIRGDIVSPSDIW